MLVGAMEALGLGKRRRNDGSRMITIHCLTSRVS
jgi:hypothetical protein